MLRYPALFAPDGDGYLVTFRDIPEAITAGSTKDEARSMSADALLSAMDFYFEDQRVVPPPSEPKKGEELVALPASASAKVLLLNAMIDKKVTPAELARRLNTSPQVVTRIVDIGHATKIDTIAEALEAMGKHLEISVD